MSTQAITDYLTKQLFIEKNIVTYRLLSRQFSIHVNEAKNELATYHHDAPYQSQTCQATFLLSGIPKPRTPPQKDDDYDMDSTPNAIQEEEEEGGERVSQAQITIVNEKDLEDAKSSFREITSIHVYSLSPAPINDAGLLCAPTELVRNTDREKGSASSAKIGCIIGKGVKMGGSKKIPLPKAPVAGPSKINIPEPKVTVKSESKESTVAVTDKGKEKPKATGKLQFFTKPKESANPPIKKEEPADSKKKMFFSKPAAPAKSVEPTVSKEVKEVASKKSKEVPDVKETNTAKENKADKPEISRGVKRKSSVGLETRQKSTENPVATTSKVPAPAPAAETHGRSKRRVVLSDDEESDNIVSKPARRKPRASYKTESTENSEAERDAKALMDIDDDQVERVSRVPSTNASSNELDDDNDDQDTSPGVQDEDVSMEEIPVKPKPKPRKPKNVVPVGSNGLKKKKVTKTRKIKDANGYIVREDYSDWESVEEGEEEAEAPALKAVAKPKAKAVGKVKKEEVEEDLTSSQLKEKAKATEPAPAKKAPTKPKPAAKGTSVKGKTQQTLNFFGPKKT